MAARPYAQELARVLRSTMSRIDEPQHPLLAHRPEQRILVLVLAGERGLAGAFNANILRKANDSSVRTRLKRFPSFRWERRAGTRCKSAGFQFAGEYVNVLARVNFATARDIAGLVTELYAKEEIDAVYIVFSEFKTVMIADLKVEKLLPVEAIREEEETASEKESGQIDYIYEQPEEQLLGKLLPRYIETQILRAMLESSAAEYAARMTAMEAATKNAGDVIEALTLHMNKVARQRLRKKLLKLSAAPRTALRRKHGREIRSRRTHRAGHWACARRSI